VFIAPFANVKVIVMKFVNAPSSATPLGPSINAATLLDMKPENKRTIDTIAEKKVVFINFNFYEFDIYLSLV
jgi:hypothetical protein